MKILLINPPTLHTKWNIIGAVNPPLSIMYLSAVAKQKGYEVEILDALAEAPSNVNSYNGFEYKGMSFKEIAEHCKKFDIVGITNLFSYSFPIVSALSSEIKNKINIPIVVGGTHASALPEYSLKNSEIDYVLIGEGEDSFIELLDSLKNGENVKSIKGIGYKKGKGVFVNKEIRFVKNLDKLPFPDRDGIDLELYYKAKEAHGPVSGKWTPIMSSRGCSFKCTYCTSPNFNNKYRSRSPENFVREIEECIEKYGIKEFMIEDENFTLEKKRVIEICKLILKKKLKIKWQLPNGIRASVTDRETLEYMKKAGCFYLCIAPESGSERILEEVINKKQNLDKVLQVAKDCVDLGIKVGAFFILGFPTEKKEDIKKTLNFALKLARVGVDDVIVSNLGMLPGSEMFYKFIKDKSIVIDDKFFTSLVTISDFASRASWSEYVSGDYIMRMRGRITFLFHLNKLFYHPLKTMKSFFNILTLKQETKTEKAAINLIKR